MVAVKNKIPVAVLGATGVVGQRFVQLLSGHPWFELAALAGSERSAGKPYGEACSWRIGEDMPAAAAEMIVQPLQTDLPAKIVFSALPSSVAREIEPRFAEAGYLVCSNSSAYRISEDVPLLIPELNADHVKMIAAQRRRRGWPGLIVTSPNCTTTGMVIPLKPLDDAFGLQQVFAVSMQAISGAGHPGTASLDITDNILPFILDEEEKFERETRLLLGQMNGKQRRSHEVLVSAQANRVPVIDGHTVCFSVKCKTQPTPEQAIEVLEKFRGPECVSELPSAPTKPLIVRREEDRPQPRIDRDAEGGMAVTVGRVRECRLLDLQMVSVVHNTLRGAAGGAILNGELLVAEGLLEVD